MKILSACGLENLHKAGLVALIPLLVGACWAGVETRGGQIVRPVISETLGASAYQVGRDTVGSLCVTITTPTAGWTDCGVSQLIVLGASSDQGLLLAGFVYPPAAEVILVVDGARRKLDLTVVPDSDALTFGSVLAPPPDLVSLEVVDGVGNLLQTHTPTIHGDG